MAAASRCAEQLADVSRAAAALAELEAMRMSVAVLGASGAGKAVNKLKKSDSPLAPRANRPRASAFLISPIPSPFARSSVAAHQIIQKLAFTERFERSPRFVARVRARRRRRRRLHDRPRRRPVARAC